MTAVVTTAPNNPLWAYCADGLALAPFVTPRLPNASTVRVTVGATTQLALTLRYVDLVSEVQCDAVSENLAEVYLNASRQYDSESRAVIAHARTHAGHG